MELEQLASDRRFVTHIRSNWDAFRFKRGERLRQKERYGDAVEKVTENIIEDLLTIALD